MNKTYREIIEFINAAGAYLRTHPAKNKFQYALEKESKRAMRSYESFNEEVEDLRVKHCAVDKDGVILRDERNAYKFTKEGLNEFNKAQRALADKAVTIEAHVVDEAPELSDQEKEAFADFVIGPDTKFTPATPPPENSVEA